MASEIPKDPFRPPPVTTPGTEPKGPATPETSGTPPVSPPVSPPERRPPVVPETRGGAEGMNDRAPLDRAAPPEARPRSTLGVDPVMGILRAPGVPPVWDLKTVYSYVNSQLQGASTLVSKPLPVETEAECALVEGW